MTITVDDVLAAGTWADLHLPRTKAGLRAGERAVHPDMCPDPRATAAFMHLNDLYTTSTDFALRVATATRQAPGILTWTPRAGFEDLAGVARKAMDDVAGTHHDGPRFTTWALPDGHPDGEQLTVGYRDDPDEHWWFLSDIGKLDERTVVWVAKRLAAAITLTEQAGWVHGDIHPGTVAVNPAHHGLRLDGWWTAIRIGARITVTPTATTPPRWLGGAGAQAAMSVAQAAAMLLTASELTGPLHDVLARQALTPTGPAALFTQIDEAARQLFGNPAWHELAEPATEPI